MHFIEEVKNYIPVNEQEIKDKELILDSYRVYGDFMTKRECNAFHMSSSAWIVNKDRTRILLNFHNLYNHWGWMGGHADGEVDMLDVIIREVEEESGLKDIKLLKPNIVSLEILPVSYHFKRGKFVSSHTHMNVTYLFEADENLKLRIKPDENSALKWFNIDDVLDVCGEECMKPIYKKLNDIVKSL